MLSFFPLDVLDGIWDLIESVSDGFLTYSFIISHHVIVHLLSGALQQIHDEKFDMNLFSYSGKVYSFITHHELYFIFNDSQVIN